MPSCKIRFQEKILKMLMRWVSHARPYEALKVMSKTFKQSWNTLPHVYFGCFLSTRLIEEMLRKQNSPRSPKFN